MLLLLAHLINRILYQRLSTSMDGAVDPIHISRDSIYLDAECVLVPDCPHALIAYVVLKPHLFKQHVLLEI